MLGENIKNLRKQKGYSQETLAERLHVVRQTISKWEKGISVPDAVMLNRIAELFEVSVDELLGSVNSEEQTSEISEIAKQLAVLNDRLAEQTIRRRRMIKRLVIGVIVVGILLAALYICLFATFKYVKQKGQVLTTTTLECELDGETYTYEVTYDENYQIIAAGGDAWIANHVETEQYSDANIMIAQIEDYFKDRGGTCKIDEIK